MRFIIGGSCEDMLRAEGLTEKQIVSEMAAIEEGMKGANKEAEQDRED